MVVEGTGVQVVDGECLVANGALEDGLCSDTVAQDNAFHKTLCALQN